MTDSTARIDVDGRPVSGDRAAWHARSVAWWHRHVPVLRRLASGPGGALAVAVLALGLLTSVTPPATEDVRTDVRPVATDAPDLPEPPADRTAPQIAPVEVGADEPAEVTIEPSIPTIAPDDRDLTTFRSAAVPESEGGGVVPVDLVVRAAEGDAFDLDDLDDALAGARHVAAAARFAGSAGTAAGADDADRDVSVFGVDATSFRPLTPEVTAASDQVWDRLREGDALVQHDVARELDLELGDAFLLTTDEGVTTTLRVGALAANGTPPLADVLVSTQVARDLGRAAPDTLVVAVDGDLEPVIDALSDATDADVAVRRPDPEPVGPPERQGTSPSGSIEPFTYTSRADGSIRIHGDWEARNIVRIELPGMPASRCNRVMVPQLYAAIEELIERGLYDHLDPSQFAGCFNARHIDRNPARPLSMHAWGLAIDFNARDNALGAVPQMDPDVVNVFRRWGFTWGGDWRRPDGMHFELERIVSTG